MRDMALTGSSYNTLIFTLRAPCCPDPQPLCVPCVCPLCRPPRFNYLWVTMPKIIDAINRTYASGGTTVSLEFFPAKTEEGVSNLLSRIEVQGAVHFQPTHCCVTPQQTFL